MTLVVSGAVAIFDGHRVLDQTDLRLRDGRRATTKLDATGCVVTPGLVNAHHHLLQSGFRTLPGTRGVAMSDWLPAMAAAYNAAGIAAAVDLGRQMLDLGISGVNLSGGPGDGDEVAYAEAVAQIAAALN